MKICSIYRHYWPDTTPYARLLRPILESRVLAGDEVEDAAVPEHDVGGLVAEPLCDHRLDPPSCHGLPPSFF